MARLDHHHYEDSLTDFQPAHVRLSKLSQDRGSSSCCAEPHKWIPYAPSTSPPTRHLAQDSLLKIRFAPDLCPDALQGMDGTPATFFRGSQDWSFPETTQSVPLS